MAFNMLHSRRTSLLQDMNILFIEDERALAESALLQLEHRGHRVQLAYTVKEARKVLADPFPEIDCVIADHRLPDGFGIHFVIGAKAVNPDREYAVVSGCLSDKNIAQLEKYGIPYFRKPLLYSHVLEQLRIASIQRKAAGKPNNTSPDPGIEP